MCWPATIRRFFWRCWQYMDSYQFAHVLLTHILLTYSAGKPLRFKKLRVQSRTILHTVRSPKCKKCTMHCMRCPLVYAKQVSSRNTRAFALYVISLLYTSYVPFYRSKACWCTRHERRFGTHPQWETVSLVAIEVSRRRQAGACGIVSDMTGMDWFDNNHWHIWDRPPFVRLYTIRNPELQSRIEPLACNNFCSTTLDL